MFPSTHRFILCCAAALVSAGAARAAAPDFAGEVKPLLESLCFKCHGNGKKKGGLALDAFLAAPTDAAHEKDWSKVLENLRNGRDAAG